MINISQDNALYGLIEKIIMLPQEEIVKIIDFVSDFKVETPKTMEKSQKRNFDFITDVPPLPDSFFDPLPDEELDLWSL